MTNKTATKAEKLASAMNDFMSGGRPFTRNVAAQVRDELRKLSDERGALTTARPLDEWNEDMGHVVWWCLHEGQWLGEPAWIGSPLSTDWPGYHTHFTPHPPFPNRL